MDRRDILKLGAATALTGCASARAVSFRAIPAPPAMSSTEVDGVLADLDATLDNMAKSSFTPDHLAHLDTLDARRVARGHDLTMRTLAAMHVAATFRELPPEAQTRPDVQQRMWGLLPALDNTMLDMADYLGSLGSAEKRELQERLRRKPSLAMDAIGVLDEHASGVGVSGRRRAQMRAIAAHASWRMTRQSVDALLGETLDKVERVKERHGRDEQVQRAIVAKVAEAQLSSRTRPCHLRDGDVTGAARASCGACEHPAQSWRLSSRAWRGCCDWWRRHALERDER